MKIKGVHKTDIWYRFINNQLQLEADAREALPYVRSRPGSLAIVRLTWSEHQQLYKFVRTPTTDPFRMLNMQPATFQPGRFVHSCWCLLLLLGTMPRRT
jgi:hypothetical protein